MSHGEAVGRQLRTIMVRGCAGFTGSLDTTLLFDYFSLLIINLSSASPLRSRPPRCPSLSSRLRLRLVSSRSSRLVSSRFVSSRSSHLVSAPLLSSPLPSPLSLVSSPVSPSSASSPLPLASSSRLVSSISSRLVSAGLGWSLPSAVSSCLRTRAVGVSREQQQRQQAAQSRVRAVGWRTSARSRR